jgi:hypothetical protein
MTCFFPTFLNYLDGCFADKDFPFALVLPSAFFFVAIVFSKIGDAHWTQHDSSE